MIYENISRNKELTSESFKINLFVAQPNKFKSNIEKKVQVIAVFIKYSRAKKNEGNPNGFWSNIRE